MIQPPVQEKQSIDPRDYAHRIIVAGSRGYEDRAEFHRVICTYLERFAGEPVLFISGMADTGADNLIYLWCKKFNYPCAEMPADWDNPEFRTKNGKSRAGFIRNTAMAKVATHAIVFYDGSSPGSSHMIDEAMKHGLQTKIIRINMQRYPREERYHRPAGIQNVYREAA